MSTTSFVLPNDLSDLCRVCMRLPEESQYLDLTTIYDEEDNLTYGECFTICTQIDLNAGEGIPHSLCKTCGLELQVSYDFYKKIEESKRVIEQCQRQFEEQKTNTACTIGHSNRLDSDVDDLSGIVQLISDNVLSTDELSGASQEIVDVSVMQLENKQEFDASSEMGDDTHELDIINNICRTETNIEYEPPDKVKNTSVDHLKDDKVKDDLKEEELEMEDYQNLEALEEEDTTISISTAVDSQTSKLPSFVHISRSDFCANVQCYVSSPLSEETVIEEEIPQDATENWLNTTNDIRTKQKPSSEYTRTKTKSNKKTDTRSKELELPAEVICQQETTPPAKAKDLFKIDKTTICTVCNESFTSHKKLCLHMRLHVKEPNRYKCPVDSCNRMYASKQACDLHYKQTHLDVGRTCPTCLKIFSCKQTLEVHMRYHRKEFPYKCNLCERKFAQKCHLTQHVEVKHHNLRYICTEPDCEKIFQNSVSLRNHRYTHSSMPFKCNRCDREYPQKNKLRAHLLNKHKLQYSLDDLEAMRQFNIIRTRHSYVKVQTVEVHEPVNVVSEDLTSTPMNTQDI